VSVLQFLSETFFDPIVSAVVGAQGAETYAGVKQELISRMAARFGAPGNHDIERAIRVAQFQAMILTLNEYETWLNHMERHEGPVDAPYSPQIFVSNANGYLDKHFRFRISVSVESEFIVLLRETVSSDIELAASGQPGPGDRREEISELVEKEFLKASGFDVLPPSFVDVLRNGRPNFSGWIDLYRIFLCEQIKTNKRFSSILTSVMLETISRKSDHLAATQAQISGQLEELAKQQQQLAGLVGKALAEADFGPTSSVQIVELLSELISGNSDAILKKMDARFDHAIDNMFRDLEASTRPDDAIAAFHYTQAIDPFVGRSDIVGRIEAELLDAGLSDEKPPKFRWMALCGEGGTGKSRLAREIISRNSNVWIHAGFVDSSLLGKTDEVFEIGRRLRGPTLLVIDYSIAARAEANLPMFLKAWADYSKSEGAQPVRIIVITRRSEEPLLHELRGAQGNPNMDMSRVQNGEISSSPVTLGGLSSGQAAQLMRHRMQKTALDLQTQPIEIDDDRLVALLDRFDNRRRPLFAALVAAEFQRGALPDHQSNLEQNRLALFGTYLTRQKNDHWLPRAVHLGERQRDNTVVTKHANLVRLATSCGDVGVSLICNHVSEDAAMGKGFFPKLTVDDDSGAIRAPLIATMTGEELKEDRARPHDPMMPPPKIIPRLEPDLLGERLFLSRQDHLDDHAYFAPVETLAQLSWRCAPDSTAAFLRMASQDFPNTMHEMRWLPPQETSITVEIARARAKMLRNVCSDIATRCGRGTIEADELTRLFDIAARLGNAAIPYIDPITSVEDQQQSKSRTTTISRDFAQGGTTSAQVATRLDEVEMLQPMPSAIEAIVAERLPPLLDRSRHFLMQSGAYVDRRLFEDAVSDILASICFRLRNDTTKGGRWSIPRDEAAEALVSQWRDHIASLGSGNFDDIAIMAGLTSALTYVDYQNTLGDYSYIYELLRRELGSVESVDPVPAAAVFSMLGNALVLDGNPDNIPSEERAHVDESIGIFLKLIRAIDFTREVTTQQMRAAVRRVINAANSALFQGARIEDARLVEVASSLFRALDRAPVDTLLPADILNVLASLPEDLPPDVAVLIDEAVSARLLRGAIDVDNFLSPNEKEPTYALMQLIFGLPKPYRRLEDRTALALLDVLSSKVGAKTDRAALNAIFWTLDPSAEQRAHVPIELARSYLAKQCERHGFDDQDHIASAMLALWGHEILNGQVERVQEQISALWESNGDRAAVRGHILALWGTAIVFDVTREPNEFTRSWSSWLKSADLLSHVSEESIQRLLTIGLSEREAREYIANYNLALIDACSSAARLDILSGGDASGWINGGETR
jgi:hypothetical protein